MTEYGFHPASALFPIMADDELAELAKDIKENGLVEAIVLHEGLVLDGRNRLEACKRAGVNPHFVDWDGGGSPTLYVLSKNLHRRHLTTSQRAVIAAESMPMLQEEAKKRIAQGRPRLGKYPMAESPEVIPEHTSQTIQEQPDGRSQRALPATLQPRRRALAEESCNTHLQSSGPTPRSLSASGVVRPP